jgi:replicative DNA helicase
VTDLHPFLKHLADVGAWTPPERPPNGHPATSNGTAGTTTPPPAGDPQAARYANTALTREAHALATTPPGGRNHALNTAAFRMAQLAANGWIDTNTIRNQLADAAHAAGLNEHETHNTITSGIAAGLTAPRHGVELHPAGQPITPAHTIDQTHTSNPVDDPDEPDGQRPRQIADGDTYILDAPTTVPAIWGQHDDVLWAKGEPLILTGPTGTGKTTLGTMLIAGRMGLLNETLGLPVTPGRRVLVLAMDRPRQIQRAMARLLRHYPRNDLHDRLIVWQGPPPADLGKNPAVLLAMAQEYGCDTVVIDSLKDAALRLSDEETGQGLSRAMNYCVTNDVEILAYHHQTKRTGGSGIGKPNTLADVYGSSWITAGAGSVVLLWGNAGDLIVELKHLKQPAAEVGPFMVGHDHTAGRSFLLDGESDTEKIIDALATGPSTVPAVASWLYGEKTDRAVVEKVRRRLDNLVSAGVLVLLDDPASPPRGGGGKFVGKPAQRYSLPSVKVVTTETESRTESRNGGLLHGNFLNFEEPPGRTESREKTAPSHDQPSRRITENHVSPGRTESRRITPPVLHRITPPSPL